MCSPKERKKEKISSVSGMTGYCSVAVQTGFRMPGDGCIPEGVLQEICLTTVGFPALDTVLTVSVTYGTAGAEGKDA